MTRRTAGILSWSLAAGCIALAIVGLWLQTVTRRVDVPGPPGSRQAAIIVALVYLVYPVIGAAIVSREPRNVIGWFLIAIGVLSSMFVVLDGYGIYALRLKGTGPYGRETLWFANWNFIMGWTFAGLLFLLFPDGRPPSARWRPLVWALCGWAALVAVAAVGAEGPLPRYDFTRNPFGVIDLGRNAPEAIRYVGMLGIIALGSFAVGSLVVRLRRSETEQRIQIKWLAFAAVAILFGLLAWMGAAAVGAPIPSIETGAAILGTLIPISIGVAILRHRLYDVDVIINRAVVFGLLALFITATYVTVVAWIGAAVGLAGERRTGLTILATAIVAVAFEPVRRRANHLANRIVYGERATPYEVLADFSERMSTTYSTEDVLPQMARVLGEGIGARIVEVWLRVGREIRPVARWPEDEGEPEATHPSLPLSDEGDLPEVPGMQTVIPVRLQDDLLGAVAVLMPGREPLSRSQERLLGDLAAQASLVLRNVRLIAELRASRQRIVAAQDAERRRIERNIHDGAQQQLVALAIRMRLAANVAGKQAPEVAAMLEELQAEANDALENLRDLARGIYPPVLADQGLVAALSGQARKSSIPVEIRADGIGRFPQEVEAAVYFVTMEALQNIAKYAQATQVLITIDQQDGELRFAITDDGVGFDTASAKHGSGLTNMQDRVAALGGRFGIGSAPGRGTTVRAEIPVQPSRAIPGVIPLPGPPAAGLRPGRP